MADAGVKMGLPRQTALLFSAQAVKGAAQMIIETEQHPDLLKDNVCSPGGTTIDGVYSLEKSGFRGIIMKAVVDTIEKSILMEKES